MFGSEGVISLFHMFGVSSLWESFQQRSSTIEIPATHAVNPRAKVRALPVDKVAKAQSEIIAKTLTVVDLGPKIAGTATGSKPVYGAVFVSEPEHGECDHCDREIKDKPHKMGIPLYVRDDRFHHMLIVAVEGRACGPRCALAFIIRMGREAICYEGREMIMKQLNEICFPGTELLPADDKRLGHWKGGPMTDEQFDKGQKSFSATPNIQYRLCNLTFASA